jgi:integrase
MAPRHESIRPLKRKGFWYLIRRVPRDYAAHDPREFAVVSTGIRIMDDPRGHKAHQAVKRLDAELMQYWEDKRAGRDPDAEARYERARQTACRLGFSYAPAQEAAPGLPVEEILRRIETLEARGTVESAPEVAAVLGGEKAPVFMIGSMVDEFELIVAASLVKKSERQKKKWRVPKDTALAKFMDVIGGDRPINALTRTDALAFRSFWQERIVSGEVEIDTANKSIGRISSMFRAINENKQFGLPAIFENLRIGGGKDKQRVAFAPEFVQLKILADGMFADLNPEARRVIYLVSETGLRLSEACNLSRTTIRLNAPVPHVQIRPEGREIKTDQSQRDIPLVGAALMAMREQPDGFPRYRDKADSLSALVNQALEARGLRPETGQTLYSLRHTFEDRLTAVEAPEKVVAALMGHKWHRPRYGLGPSLEQKREWLNRIAFRPPVSV